MNEIRTNKFLAEIIDYSKTIGDKRNAPFTAERFIVAIIDKSGETPDGEKSIDQKRTEALLDLITKDRNMDKVKRVLTEHISGDKNVVLVDDLYMKKRIQVAGRIAKDKGEENVTAFSLLESIIEEPDETIKKILDFDSGNNEDDEHSQTGGDTQNSKDATSAKNEMVELVSAVKCIREELSSAIFGQDNAINTFVTGYFQAGMLSMLDKSRVRPRATFLFSGPPGVGKTFMAEKAAEALKLPFMRFDMSEYANSTASFEFCGYDKLKPGNVTGFVDSHPKCVILFDEIEKAHMCTINLFLQMLDAGRLRDKYTNEEVSFSEAIIILTTNAGRQLYEESDTGDFSSVSRKAIIKALQRDINPLTKEPYFPDAICSRFASGNVVMFNHISANFLKTIAKNEIECHASNLKKEIGIELQVDENVYTTLLFSEGASVDARTIKSRAEAFFNDELYELLRLIASDKVTTGIEDIEKVCIGVDLSNAKPEVMSLFESEKAPEILVFADDNVVSVCKEKLPSLRIAGVHDLESAKESLKSDDIGFVMVDMRYGVRTWDEISLNVEDINSLARDFYKFVSENRRSLPVYLVETDEAPLTEEERVTFFRQGVR